MHFDPLYTKNPKSAKLQDRLDKKNWVIGFMERKNSIVQEKFGISF